MSVNLMSSQFRSVTYPLDANSNPVSALCPVRTFRYPITAVSAVVPFVITVPVVLLQVDCNANIQFFGEFADPVDATFDSFPMFASVQFYMLSVEPFIFPRPELTTTAYPNPHFGISGNYMAGVKLSIMGMTSEGIFAGSTNVGNIWISELS